MTINLNELLNGKGTKIKENIYFPTEVYVTPFLERMQSLTDEFIINVKTPSQISITESENDYIYNRVWIQAVLPDEYAWDNHRKVISMLYALDTRKPIVKIYSGAINNACLNTCVFNPESLSVAELEPESAIDYGPVNRVMNVQDNIHETLQTLASRSYRRDLMYTELGTWVDRCITSKYSNGFGNVKLAETTPIEAYKLLFYDSNSPYYTQKNTVDGFTVYNAFTQLITDGIKRDISNVFEKTILLREILGV